jgi:hypothetical protein
MRGAEAKKVCPEIILIQVPTAHAKADLTIYRDAGDQVVKLIQSLSPKIIIEKASIDEVYLDITNEVNVVMNTIKNYNSNLLDTNQQSNKRNKDNHSYNSNTLTSTININNSSSSSSSSSSTSTSSDNNNNNSTTAICNDDMNIMTQLTSIGQIMQYASRSCVVGDDQQEGQTSKKEVRNGYVRQGILASNTVSITHVGDNNNDNDINNNNNKYDNNNNNDNNSSSNNNNNNNISSSNNNNNNTEPNPTSSTTTTTAPVDLSVFTHSPHDYQRLLCGAAIIALFREQIYNKLGFTSSSGIAHNKMLAKVASSMHKPNKQTLVPNHRVIAFMENLPISRVQVCVCVWFNFEKSNCPARKFCS